MAINFPDNPSNGDTYSLGGRVWQWNGYAWRRIPDPGAKGQKGQAADKGEKGQKGLGDKGQKGEPSTVKGQKGEVGNKGESIKGQIGEQNDKGEKGQAGVFGGVTFEYKFNNSTTDADPGAGKLALNAGSVSGSTRIFIDDVDGGGTNTNIESYLRTIDDSTSTIKGHVRITNKGDSDKFAMFSITGASVEATGYHKVVVTHISGDCAGAGIFSNNEDIIITFARTGDIGDKGIEGDKGQKGDSIKGQKGQDGEVAEKGQKGQDGNKCQKGDSIKGQKGEVEKGQKGEQNDKGQKGEVGDKGQKGQGDKGQKGALNDKGQKGEPNLDKGDKGQKGEDGDKGQKGEDNSTKGQKGEPSTIKGQKGEDGDKGQKGAVEAQGNKGNKGQKGQKGIKGQKGAEAQDGVAGTTKVAKLFDEKTQNTGGGTYSTSDLGTWQNRTLNTKTDPNSIVTLDSGNVYFSVPAGSYEIKWDTPAYMLGNFQSRLQYDDNSSFSSPTSVLGSTEHAPTNAGVLNAQLSSTGIAIITVSENTYVRIQIQASGTPNDANALGKPSNIDTEIYTQVSVEDLSSSVLKGQKGESVKGQKGEDDSTTGQRGDDGDKGESIKGEKGEDNSTKGQKGEAEKGQKGQKGIKGQKGESIKGQKGELGLKGLKGQKGEVNDKGQKGAASVASVVYDPTCSNWSPSPITVSGNTITISDESNAYGAKWVQTTAPTTGVCNGDIWYDTSSTQQSSFASISETVFNYTTNGATQTWTKPSNGTMAHIWIWGGGGCGSFQNNGAGGGGGGAACCYQLIKLSDLPSSVSIVIGKGGSSHLGGEIGESGQNSTFATTSDSYYMMAGGGFGGSSGSGGDGGVPYHSYTSTGMSETSAYTGGHGGTGSQTGAPVIFGAGGGGGGNGGGGSFSSMGGNGGANRTAGSVPGGGGGSRNSGSTASVGAGGHGQCKIIVI